MAKKKIPTLDDAIKAFKDVTTRASLSSYYHVNQILLSNNADGNKILVIPDGALMGGLTEDPEIKMEALDIGIPEQYELNKWFKYGKDLESEGWLPIDVTEELFSGKIFKVKIAQYEYSVPINRELLPLKLKKAEYDGISYRIFGTYKNIGGGVVAAEPIIMGIKKRFEGPAEVNDAGFSMIRLFQVV